MSDRLGQMRTKNSCRAKTKNGEPCQAAATEGGLCFFHSNPKKASELGQIGGRKNRRHTVEMDSLARTRERHGYPSNAPADHCGNLFKPTLFKDRRDFWAVCSMACSA
jgi:hypothetical protein